MSTCTQSPTTPPALTAEAWRLLKARALSVALASCRTPTDAVRFIFAKSTELRQRQRVAEAALRAGR